MNELQIFNNPDFGEVRTLETNGKVLFCGSDVAKALGYSRPSDALAAHCRYTVKRSIPHPQSPDKTIEMSFIPESDLYRLGFSSKLPNAERFTDWVTEEVLPSIRKNGGYIAGQEQMIPEELMARALDVAHNIIRRLETENSNLTVKNSIMAPKADYFDQLVDRNLLTNFRETAKELGIAPRTFVQFLLDKKYIYRDQKGKLLPYEGKNDGLFEVKECTNSKTQWSGVQTLVTPKGRETFRLLCIG